MTLVMTIRQPWWTPSARREQHRIDQARESARRDRRTSELLFVAVLEKQVAQQKSLIRRLKERAT